MTRTRSSLMVGTGILCCTAVLGFGAGCGGAGSTSPDGGGSGDGGSPMQGGGSGTRHRIGSSGDKACAIRDDGALECWYTTVTDLRIHPELTNVRGVFEGGLFLFGDGTGAWLDENNYVFTPKPVVGASGGVEIAYGGTSVFWLGADGNLLENTNYGSPAGFAPVAGATDVVDFAADGPCIVHGDHTVACGNPLEAVAGITDAVAVTIGSGGQSCALRSGGGIVCWGRNEHGQLGDGTTTATTGLVDVQGISGAVDVVAGWYGGCALIGDGTVKCWGDNSQGQLGTGSTSATPQTGTAVPGVTSAIAITWGDRSGSLVLNRDMTFTFWGDPAIQGNGSPRTLMPDK